MMEIYIDGSNGFTLNRFFSCLASAGIKLSGLKRELKKLALPKKTRMYLSVKKYNGYISKFSSNDDAQERTWQEIKKVIEKSKIDGKIKKQIMKAYGIIAKAEAHVHGTSVGKIHFHEIGKWHNLARIAGIFIALRQLKINRVSCSKINTGSGYVHAAHGRMPVPAPATKNILRSEKIPYYRSDIKKELVTPSSAAMLGVIVNVFEDLPGHRNHKKHPLGQKPSYHYGYEAGNDLPLICYLQLYNEKS